ncbi:MAG: helix-turn-helix transcriptional regulator [Saprospiraceae bacterium]|nr:helix-turn-helix transcriptional regulator [Saprospiraceae bacterium]
MPFSIILIGFSYSKIRTATNIYPKEKQWLAFNSLSILAFLVSWLFSDPIASFFNFAIWEYLLALLGIFLVVVTYLGVHHLNIAEQRRALKKLGQSSSPTLVKATTTNKSVVIPNEQAAIPQRIEEKIHRLEELMSIHQLYHDPDLTRAIVASKIGISEGYLSELIKVGLKTSFNDYVNEFRVKRVIAMFHDEKFDIFSIEAIGFEAGFKSKSVFYDAFKKVTKKTPGAYRKTLNLS